MVLGDERRRLGLAVYGLEGAAEARDGVADQFGARPSSRPRPRPSTDDRSNGCWSWHSIIATSMVGTPRIAVTFSRSIRCSTAAGSNTLTRKIGQPAWSAPSVIIPQPLVWNIGMKFAHTESGPIPTRCA